MPGGFDQPSCPGGREREREGKGVVPSLQVSGSMYGVATSVLVQSSFLRRDGYDILVLLGP